MKKHYALKSLCLVAAMIFCGFSAKAQFETSIFLNGAAPTAQLNDKVTLNQFQLLGKEAIGEGATLGFGLGARASYVFDIGFGSVAPFASADVLWNPIKASLRDEYAINKASTPNYFNIPLMLGVQYRYPLPTMDFITPFAEFGVGYDFFITTSEGWKGDAVNPYQVYNTKGAMAWQIGAGTYLGSHVSLGLYYYALGKHSITYSDRSSDDIATTLPDVERRSVGELMLRIGFHF